MPAILALIRELAAYEREPAAAVATEEDLLRDGFGAAPRFHCLMALWDGEGAGFAFYFHNYSTWQGKWGLYLEDLFVRPALRRRGVGRALFLHLARLAVERRCGRFEWAVLDWNEPAIAFYRSLGAVPLSDWTVFRLTGDALAAAAAK